MITTSGCRVRHTRLISGSVARLPQQEVLKAYVYVRKVKQRIAWCSMGNSVNMHDDVSDKSQSGMFDGYTLRADLLQASPLS